MNITEWGIKTILNPFGFSSEAKNGRVPDICIFSFSGSLTTVNFSVK